VIPARAAGLSGATLRRARRDRPKVRALGDVRVDLDRVDPEVSVLDVLSVEELLGYLANHVNPYGKADADVAAAIGSICEVMPTNRPLASSAALLRSRAN
jgi:hypothetical protein